MFYGCKSSNQPLSSWDVSAVTSTRMMFSGAASFSQDLGTWNVHQVGDMNFMFKGASSFNQDLCPWREKLSIHGAATAVPTKTTEMVVGSGCPNNATINPASASA